MADNLKEVEIELAGVKKELSFTESLLLRVEQHNEQLIEITADLKARQDVQEERLANLGKALPDMAKEQEDHRRETMEQYERLHKRITDTERQMSERLDRIERHLQKIEMWRWMIAGSLAVIGWIAGKLDFGKFF